MSLVAIVDYGSGNLRSAERALERAAAAVGDGQHVVVTDEAQVVADADRVVLPGVGAFGDCARGLAAVDGMRDALEHTVRVRGRPFLGICVGMQLMATAGLEFGRHDGFDWVTGEVRPLREPDAPVNGLRYPHMGWNELDVRTPPHPVLAGLHPGDHVYFVHSFAMVVDQDEAVLATSTYGKPFAAVIGRDNMVGTQFHPEKSQAVGLKILSNFLSWSP